MGQVETTELNDEDLSFLKQETAMNETTILKWWNEFQTDCPNGKMTSDQLLATCNLLFPGSDSRDYKEHLMRLFDTNQDGVVDFKEFLTAMNVATDGNEQNKLKHVFKLYDVDGDTVLTLKEMVTLMKASHKALYPDKDEACVETEAAVLFDELDENKDGKVTEEEFIKASTKSRAPL